MAEKKMYPFQERQVAGESIAFSTPQGEVWTQYELADGSKLRAKIVMTEIVRLDEHDDKGNPIYLFNAQQVVSLIPEISLTKKVS